MTLKPRTTQILALMLALVAGPAEAQETPPVQFSDAELTFFEKNVRPLLVARCLKCHGGDPADVKGGLRLTTRAGVLEGGESGPVVVPGEPQQSLLIDAVRHNLLEMPPDGKLSEAEIDVLVRWIELGVPDPRVESDATVTAGAADLEKGREFWAFQPPRATPVPQVRDTSWPSMAIDHYILARLEAEGLQPVGDADRATLLRRAHFALVGLPPTPEQSSEFVADPAPLPEAFAKVVDRLLASPRFGERWGRHWLDVARFAESSGGGRSLMFPDAWRYRDYVIRSYNDDKPFDRFLREQIAGDLLPSDSPGQRAEQVIATGLLALGPTNYEQQDKELLRLEVIDEQIDTVGRAMLGLTLGCARCHDHKFDAIPTRDYYALAGIFGGTETLTPGNVSGYVKTPLPAPPAVVAAREEHRRKVESLEQRLADTMARLKEPAAEGEPGKAEGGRGKTQRAPTVDSNALLDKPAVAPSQVGSNTLLVKPEVAPDQPAGDEALRVVKQLEAKLAELKQNAPPPPAVAMSVRDVENPSDGHLHIRGGVRSLGPTVPRGFLTAAMADPATPEIASGQSGRVELANWIASPDNPLTARVYVNRVWQHLFGVGLVATPDNHGTKGTRPTHPELLDHLALQFIADGWSTKKLIRRIMLSHAFRLSTERDERALAVDRENRLLGRANRRRLDAEVLRDSMLAVSGQLDLTPGGLTIRQLTQYDLGYEFDTVRRSVYVPAFRNSMLELFEVFDVANPNLVVGRRTTSTLPTQALYLMNSPFVVEQSRHAARRLLAQDDLDDAGRVDLAFRRVLGREPTGDEAALALEYIRSFVPDDPAIDDRLEAWSSFCHSLFASLDFRYVD